MAVVENSLKFATMELNSTIPQNRDKKNQFTELRPFREANTAVAIEIPNANRIQKKPRIDCISMFQAFRA